MFSPDEIALAFTLLSLPTPAPTHFTLTLFNFSACRRILRHKYIRGHGGVAGAGLPCRPGSSGLLSFLWRMNYTLSLFFSSLPSPTLRATGKIFPFRAWENSSTLHYLGMYVTMPPPRHAFSSGVTGVMIKAIRYFFWCTPYHIRGQYLTTNRDDGNGNMVTANAGI